MIKKFDKFYLPLRIAGILAVFSILFLAVYISRASACHTGCPITTPPPCNTGCPTTPPSPTQTPQPTATATPVPTTPPAPGPTDTPTPPTNNPPSGPNPPGGGAPPCVSSGVTTIPTIIEEKRLDANTIFVSWGPFAGLNTFIVQYGFTSSNLQYNTKVTGFSTNIGSLPSNQKVYVQVAATDNCQVGQFGPVATITGTNNTNLPALPGTGFEPQNFVQNLALFIGVVSLLSLSVLLFKRRKILSWGKSN